MKIHKTEPIAALSVMALTFFLMSCQRQPLETLSEDVLKERRSNVLNSARPESKIAFAKWPEGLAKAPIRLLAEQGLFEEFDPVTSDELSEIDPAREELWTMDFFGVYRRFIPKTPVLASTEDSFGERLYRRRKAPALKAFEKKYDVEIIIDHLVPPVFEKAPPGEGELEADSEVVFKDGLSTERTKDYDLIFASRHRLSNLKRGENIAAFDRLNVARAAQYKKSTLKLFPNIPIDPEYTFTLPYYWISYGLIYEHGRVITLPRHWADFFEFSLDTNLWGQVSFLAHQEIVFGTAAHYWDSISYSNKAHMAKSNAEIVGMVRDIIGYDANGSAETSNEVSELTAALQKSPADNPELSYMKQEIGIEKRIMRALFAATALERAYARTIRLNSTDLYFNLPSESELLTNSLSDLYSMLENQEASLDSIVEVVDEKEVEQLSSNIFKSIAYGAHFRREGDVKSLTNGHVQLGIGSGADAYKAHQTKHDIRFIIPESGSFVVLYLFVHPDGRSVESRKRTAFLLDFLTQPRVASRMVEFDLLASVDENANQFLSRKITFSPIYARPERDQTLYFPIMDEEDETESEAWIEILRFFNEMQKKVSFL